jgi:hypothetical protein
MRSSSVVRPSLEKGWTTAAGAGPYQGKRQEGPVV